MRRDGGGASALGWAGREEGVRRAFQVTAGAQQTLERAKAKAKALCGPSGKHQFQGCLYPS